MYAGAGVIGLLGVTLPALRLHSGWQLGLGVATVLYGVLNIFDGLDWGRRPMPVHIAAMAAAMPVIAVAVWATGGSRSYLWPVLLLAPIHWGFFLRDRRVLAALCGALIVTFWTPLLYQSAAHDQWRVAVTATFSLSVVFIAAAPTSRPI
jgi:hypothetical protein